MTKRLVKEGVDIPLGVGRSVQLNEEATPAAVDRPSAPVTPRDAADQDPRNLTTSMSMRTGNDKSVQLSEEWFFPPMPLQLIWQNIVLFASRGAIALACYFGALFNSSLALKSGRHQDARAATSRRDTAM